MSISRNPGANGAGMRKTTVDASGASTFRGVAVHVGVRREHGVHPRVVERAEREEDVGGREGGAVGEGDALPQLERVDRAVGRLGPALGEPRLEGIGHAVDADERRVDQEREELAGGGCVDVAVVGRGLGPVRRHELAAAGQRGRRGAASRRAFGRRPSLVKEKPAGDRPDEDGDDENPLCSSHELPSRPTDWPTCYPLVSLGFTCG